MFSRLRSAWKATRDPLVTDRRYDVACVVAWLLAALWGILSACSELTVFQAYRQWEQAYPVIWGVSLGAFSLTASVCAAWTFFLRPEDIGRRVRCKRFEMLTLFGTIGLVGVYPVTLIFQGDTNGNFRPDIIALSLIVFPFLIFRIVHLRVRVGQLYLIQAVTR